MTTKFLLVLKICKSAANATVFLISGNPYLSKDVTETFTHRGRHKSKNGKCVVLLFHEGYEKSKRGLGLCRTFLTYCQE